MEKLYRQGVCPGFYFIFLSYWALVLVYKSPVKLNEAAKVYQGQQVWVFKGGYAKQLAQACKPLDAVYHREINQFLSCQTPENMSKILILLFALFALTHAVFERTDCSCTCKDGKVCVKAVPNYLEGNTQECQCKDGTCPSGLEFNGKYNTALIEKSNFCPKIQFWQNSTISRVFH